MDERTLVRGGGDTHAGQLRRLTFLAASAMGIVDPYPGKCATCGVIQGGSASLAQPGTTSKMHETPRGTFTA